MESSQKPIPLTAILLDDDSSQAYLLSRMIEDAPDLDIELSHYTTSERAMADLLSLKADLVFLDQNLGEGATGMEIMKSLREFGYDCAIVILTGDDDEKLIAEFLQSGADAYICKSQLDVNSLTVAVNVAMKLPHKLALALGLSTDQTRTSRDSA